jgi:hypothetical protein
MLINEKKLLIDEKKMLINRNKRLLKRFDECIDLLDSHYKLNKELRETSAKKTEKIALLKKQNGSLSIIIEDLTEINKEFEKENELLWSENKKMNSEICENAEESDCQEKIKIYLTQIEELKKENCELKKKQVFVFQASKN